ncbi:MAG: aldehyde dehydrogenase family protein, partial [Puniceicoccaceae bacterium]
ADAFRARFSEALQRRRPGDPREESTRLGPVARADARDQLHDQVRRSLEAGAELVCGGEPLAGPGFFYPPTLLDRVEPGMPAFDEEVFGPVAALVRVADEPAAVAAANRSAYGIGAAVFTADLSRGERLLTQDLNCGVGALNRQVLSSMDLPFGGTRQSGYGRELGLAGLREFLLTRSISLPSA